MDTDNIEHAEDCQPEHMTEPDENGTRDCMNCGLWEEAQDDNAAEAVGIVGAEIERGARA